MPRVRRLDEVGVDALEDALATDDELNDVRRPSMAGDAIEVDADAVEDVHAQRMHEAVQRCRQMSMPLP